MAEKILMGQRELLRSKTLEMVKQKKMPRKEAAKHLRLSYRQVLRIYKAYQERGDAALVHNLRGKRSGGRTAEADRERAIALYKERCNDFGPTFAAEKTRENEGFTIGVSTLRRILMAEGLWERARRSREYRSRREPKERFGSLIQFAGSPHDWFEGASATLFDNACNGSPRIGIFCIKNRNSIMLNFALKIGI
jgi:transposase